MIKLQHLNWLQIYINEPRFYAKRAIDNMRELMAEAGIV